ncbi:MAG: hypothetical protein WC263_01815 [Candidatus Micrarchaeia archaeon]
MQISKSKTVDFQDVANRHGASAKRAGLLIQSNTGVMALVAREGSLVGVSDRALEVIGRLVLGPMAAGDVELGKGECVLKMASGPLGGSIFYKFQEMSGAEKKEALLALNPK